MANSILFTPAQKGECSHVLYVDSVFNRYFKTSVLEPNMLIFPVFPKEDDCFCMASFVTIEPLFDKAFALYEGFEMRSFESNVVLVLSDFLCRMPLLTSERSIRRYAYAFLNLADELIRVRHLGILNDEGIQSFLGNILYEMHWLHGSVPRRDSVQKSVAETLTSNA